jgi:hypothetical protein
MHENNGLRTRPGDGGLDTQAIDGGSGHRNRDRQHGDKCK